jgi:hypothetical protein
MQRIILDHLARYPLLEIRDLYKLLHQATQGSEHAVQDTDAARRWLECELREMGAGSEEPRMDPISEDSRVARIHLRPYLASGGDPTKLLEAFIRTANTFRGSIVDLEQSWSLAIQIAAHGLLPYQHQDMQSFFTRMRALNFPTVHHSPGYEAAYHPAYRVVAVEFLEG